MIDTHCHLLPNLDDGPSSDLESVRLGRQLATEGVHVVLCTPHFSPEYPTTVESAERRLHALQSAFVSLGVRLELRLAAEISPRVLLSLDLSELQRRSVGGRFVLVEVEPDTTFEFVELALERLAEHGLFPVLAHPERSPAVHRSTERLEALRARGGLVQVVAPSLAGTWGPEVRLAAWDLVDGGVADLIASDAHHARKRLVLGAIAQMVADRHGDERRRELFEVTPRRLLDGVSATAR